ncbi:hypothetical protein EPUS_08016 [Endocarpon pusillum Z07020]|uniref:Uncharacterized protein n=1 Tax=Endocarpon pusillum (strain Z07020 / HMAS-L-300199) TaxID=1263415 RepID=U1HI07_ENDPU|nr:uncharacterized protein EPUS_08016 [Endocarpon pusillum Z07020]ERF69815.1 hypothetical protein EPUS_08016 [Endocarpon pusillum Z07020]
MAYGTAPRSDLGFSRSCEDILPRQCPGTTVQINYSDNGTTFTAEIPDEDYDTRIPKSLATLYQSGLAGQAQTVSSFFDIQWRHYSYAVHRASSTGSRYLVGTYRQLTSVLLNDALEPIEGLIVDTQSGGVGFRNHTVPQGLTFGADWTEDILFIEPETACVDTNLTLEFMIFPFENRGSSIVNLSLVDQGGFVNLNRTYPRIELTDTQTDPKLKERAYKAAWQTNALTMVYLNVTRPSPNSFSYLKSEIERHFPLSTRVGSYDSFTTSDRWGVLIDAPWAYSNGSVFNTSRSSFDDPATFYSNPFNINLGNFSDINLICQGAGANDLANITNIGAACGLVFGAARRKDGSESLIFEPESWWTQPLYSCASATKAVIKTVQFRYNSTSQYDLKALQILNITDKVYKKENNTPLWGVENPNMTLGSVTPLWGLISPEHENAVNLSTVRSDRLYLPGHPSGGVSSLPGYQNVPGTDGPQSALSSAYSIGSSKDVTNYSGKTNIAIAPTTAKIINLVWTDIAANSLVGTKSWISGSALPPNLAKRDGSLSNNAAVDVPVTVYEHQIRYRWVFAIPAAIVMFLAALIGLAALMFALMGKARPSHIRHYLFQLAPGRILTNFLYPGVCSGNAPTRIWIDQVGRNSVTLYQDLPGATEPQVLSSTLLPKERALTSSCQVEYSRGETGT